MPSAASFTLRFPSWTAAAAAYGLVGMAAVFAAAAEAPITSIMIVFEMSSDYTIILPLMVGTVIATLLGRRLLGFTIYEMKLVRQGIDWRRARNPGFYTRVRVSSVERQAPVIARCGETVRYVAARLHATEELAIPVVDGNRFVGLVAVSEIAASLAENHDRRRSDRGHHAARGRDARHRATRSSRQPF